jgi:hypothetical protein
VKHRAGVALKIEAASPKPPREGREGRAEKDRKADWGESLAGTVTKIEGRTLTLSIRREDRPVSEAVVTLGEHTQFAREGGAAGLEDVEAGLKVRLWRKDGVVTRVELPDARRDKER